MAASDGWIGVSSPIGGALSLSSSHLAVCKSGRSSRSRRRALSVSRRRIEPLCCADHSSREESAPCNLDAKSVPRHHRPPSASSHHLLKAVRDGSIGGAQTIMAQVSTLKQLLTFDMPHLLLNGWKKQQQPIFSLDEREKLAERWEGGDGNSEKNRCSEASEVPSPRCAWPRGSSPSDLRHETTQSIAVVDQRNREFCPGNPQNLESTRNSVDGIQPRSCSGDRNPRLQTPMKVSTMAATADESDMLPLQHFSGLESSQKSHQPAVGPHCLWPRHNSERQSAVANTLKSGPMATDSSVGMSRPSSNETRLSSESIPSAVIPMGSLLATIDENSILESASDVGSPSSSFESSPRCSWPRKQPEIMKYDHLSASELRKAMAMPILISEARLKPALNGDNHFVGTVESPSKIEVRISQDKAVQISTIQEEEVHNGPRCAWPRNHLQVPEEDHLNGDKEMIEQRISRKEAGCASPGSLSPASSTSQAELGETVGNPAVSLKEKAGVGTVITASVFDGRATSGAAKSKEKVDVVGPFCAWPRIAAAEISSKRERHQMAPSSFLQRKKIDTIQAVQKVESNSVSSFGLHPLKRDKPSDLSLHQTEKKSDDREGPRCVWPRIVGSASAAIHPQMQDRAFLAQAKSESMRVQHSSCMPRVGAQSQDVSQKQQEKKEVIDRGARCAWPRSRATAAADVGKEDPSKKVVLKESSLQPGAGPRCSWPSGLEEQKEKNHSDSLSCKDLPRRMLATTVGLSLMNCFLAAQGSPAMASPIDLQCLTSEFFCSEEEKEMEGRGKTKKQEVIAATKSLVLCK